MRAKCRTAALTVAFSIHTRALPMIVFKFHYPFLEGGPPSVRKHQQLSNISPLHPSWTLQLPSLAFVLIFCRQGQQHHVSASADCALDETDQRLETLVPSWYKDRPSPQWQTPSRMQMVYALTLQTHLLQSLLRFACSCITESNGRAPTFCDTLQSTSRSWRRDLFDFPTVAKCDLRTRLRIPIVFAPNGRQIQVTEELF